MLGDPPCPPSREATPWREAALALYAESRLRDSRQEGPAANRARETATPRAKRGSVRVPRLERRAGTYRRCLGLIASAARSQDILHSARCNCNAPKSRPAAQTPQVAIRFAFIRSWRALTRAAARSMATASLLPKYGLAVWRSTAPTSVRRRCYTFAVRVAVRGGGLGEPGLDGSSRMPAEAVSALETGTTSPTIWR